MMLLSQLSMAGQREITILTHHSTQAKFFHNFAPKFEKKTGVKVNIVEVPFTELGPKLMISLTSGRGDYDVVAITNLLMYGASPYLEDLGELYTPTVEKDLPPVAIDSCTDLAGVKKGFPIITSLPALFYRTDLFKERGLLPPKTWDEFLNVCQKLTIESSPVGKIWGTLIEASEKSTTGAVKLLGWFYQAGGGLIDENGKLIIDCEQNIEALSFVCDLVNKYKVAPPGAAEMIFEDVHNMFIQGRGATAINWQYMVSLANSPDSAVKGKFAVVPLPKGRKYGVNVDCWMLSVPTASKNKELAKLWIKEATTTEEQIELLRTEGLVARLSAMNPSDPRVLEINPFIDAFVDSMVRFGVPLPKWKRLNEALLRLSHAKASAITQAKSPREALEDAQREIVELLEE